MAGPQPTTILLALGAGTVGGPDALRVLLEFAGRSPLLDIAASVLAMGMVTAYLLGIVLLVRSVRGARAGGGGGAPGAAARDCLSQVTLVVSVGVACLVTACLLVAPSVASGGLGSLLHPVVHFAGKSSFVAVIVIAIAFAAAASVHRATPLLRFIRRASSNGGGAGPAPLATAGRFATTTRQTVCIICLPFAAVCLLAVASGGLDAQRIYPGFPWRSRVAILPPGVTIAMVVAGTTLLVRFSRGERNAAGAAAPTPATGTRCLRFGVLAPLAVAACVLAAPYADALATRRESTGGERACSA